MTTYLRFRLLLIKENTINVYVNGEVQNAIAVEKHLDQIVCLTNFSHMSSQTFAVQKCGLSIT